MIDSHIHIEKQPYSLKTIDQMVEVALSKGVKELWIVDHTHKFKEFMPIYEPLKKYGNIADKFFSKERISINDYYHFIDVVKAHQYPVRIKFGLEVCYFPESEELTKKLLLKYPFEIRIGSVHHIFGLPYDEEKEYWDYYPIDIIYHEYYKNNFLAIKTNMFTHLGHPDAIKRFDYFPSYDLSVEYEQLAALLAQYNLPTENNSGFARYGFETFGLNPKLIKTLQSHNVKILTSSDAHQASYVGYGFDMLKKQLI